MPTFSLPDLGEGLTEAEIVAVLVHEGDVIREDAPLLEVETDKAQVEIPSPMGGRVVKIHVEPGQTVKVGAPLVTFADGAVEPAATPAPSRSTRAPPPHPHLLRPVQPPAPKARRPRRPPPGASPAS
jgi:pyruvate dehydrogenase E2 component (dihydrolipoamide acetyltransferase)